MDSSQKAIDESSKARRIIWQNFNAFQVSLDEMDLSI